jgi:hypothetical protein
LSFLPKPKREYRALEVTVERMGADRLNFLASYVLSRSYGNYTGLFVSDANFAAPGNNFSLQLPEQARNSTGRLPNDRPHVLKLFGSYRFDFGVTSGAFLTWASGTPLNRFGATPLIFRPLFLVPRGSAGRTPSIWDANARLTYDLARGTFLGAVRPGRIILDLHHIGSLRRAVLMDQFEFLSVDPATGTQTNPNPNFGKALAYQPPMAARLGVELGF